MAQLIRPLLISELTKTVDTFDEKVVETLKELYDKECPLVKPEAKVKDPVIQDPTPTNPGGGSLFGQAAPNTGGGGLFGATAPNTGGGSLFGATAPNTGGGGMFGQAQAPRVDLFGQPPNTGAGFSTGGLFGGGLVNPYGDSKPPEPYRVIHKSEILLDGVQGTLQMALQGDVVSLDKLTIDFLDPVTGAKKRTICQDRLTSSPWTGNAWLVRQPSTRDAHLFGGGQLIGYQGFGGGQLIGGGQDTKDSVSGVIEFIGGATDASAAMMKLEFLRTAKPGVEDRYRYRPDESKNGGRPPFSTSVSRNSSFAELNFGSSGRLGAVPIDDDDESNVPSDDSDDNGGTGRELPAVPRPPSVVIFPEQPGDQHQRTGNTTQTTTTIDTHALRVLTSGADQSHDKVAAILDQIAKEQFVGKDLARKVALGRVKLDQISVVPEGSTTEVGNQVIRDLVKAADFDASSVAQLRFHVLLAGQAGQLHEPLVKFVEA